MKKILILGAGWLGLPLAKTLQADGHHVVTTARSLENVTNLENQGLRAFALDLADESSTNVLAKQLREQDIDTILGAFPPGFRQGSGEQYAEQWARIVHAASSHNITTVAMISSTTVYPNTSDSMTEAAATFALAETNTAFSDKARIMLKAEQSLIDAPFDHLVFRCSGLIGPKRHPARFASRLKQVSTLAPANMVHLDDVIGAVRHALYHCSNQVFNVTTPETVSKAEFYQAAIHQAQLDIPLPPQVATPDKRIIADKLVGTGYSFIHRSTLDAIQFPL